LLSSFLFLQLLLNLALGARTVISVHAIARWHLHAPTRERSTVHGCALREQKQPSSPVIRAVTRFFANKKAPSQTRSLNTQEYTCSSLVSTEFSKKGSSTIPKINIQLSCVFAGYLLKYSSSTVPTNPTHRIKRQHFTSKPTYLSIRIFKHATLRGDQQSPAGLIDITVSCH